MQLASEDIIEEFVSEAREVLGARLERAVLFGSYARGDHVPGSDVDIVFIVSELDEGDRESIERIQDEFLERGYLFSPRVIAEEEFDQKLEQGYVFHESIDEEGVEI